MTHYIKFIPGVIHYVDFQWDLVMASSRINTEVVAMGKKLPFSHVWQLTAKVHALLSPATESYFANFLF